MSHPTIENHKYPVQKLVGHARCENQKNPAHKSIGQFSHDNQTIFADRDKLFTELRGLTSAREALVSFRTMATNRIKQASRNCGDNKYVDELILSQLDGLKSDKKITQTPIDKQITKLAKQIPECEMFNLVTDINGAYISAATIVSILKDPRRFHSVHAMRKYCCYHVVDGKAPKHQRGKKSDWSQPAKNCLNKMVTGTLSTISQPAFLAALVAHKAT